MLPGTHELIDLLLAHLQRDIVPNVSGSEAQLSAMLLNFALSHIATEELEMGKHEEDRRRHAQALLTDIRTALTDNNALQRIQSSTLVAAIDAALSADAAPAVVESALGHATQALNTVRRARTDRHAEILRAKLIAQETRFHEAATTSLDSWNLKSMPTARGTGKSTRAVSATALTAYLRDKVHDHPDLEASRLEEIGGGFGKRTFCVDVRNGPVDWSALILRQDVLGGLTPNSVLSEIDVINCAGSRGIPVATIVWSEADAAALGAPFILQHRKAGVCAREAWIGSRWGDAAKPADQLAELLSLVHRMPMVRGGGLAIPASGREAVESYIITFAQRWHRDRPNEEPLIHAGFDWLLENVPRDIPTMTMVHADVSPRNVLIEKGSISAILDWEMCHIGDPAYDFAYIRRWFDGLLDWPRFEQVYRDAGGPAVNAENYAYWDLFSYFRDAVMLASGVRSFKEGRNRNLKVIAPALYFYRRFLADFGKRLSLLLESAPSGKVSASERGS